MHERCHGWVGILLLLGPLLPMASVSAATSAERRELDRGESLLQDWLTELAPGSGVVIARDRDRLTLRIPAALVFKPDSPELKQDALSSVPLSAALRLLRQRRLLSAQVVVYTDNIGDASANRHFSEARAKTLCSALHKAGISTLRLHQRGGGQTHALASNSTAEGRLENRRVEIAFQRSAS
jgi:outer membrane protein OmpA-like peptidoglycan-associated protein